MKPPTKLSASTGTSDPLTYTCSCSAATSSTGGLVLLFYRYYANSPILPTPYLPQTEDLKTLESWHHSLTSKYKLSGKIRIAKEGFNITVGGTTEDIKCYMEESMQHWTFTGLSLSTESEREAFFKPTPGCVCVFPTTSIKVCSEITPMGVTNYSPSSWATITPLSPASFHARCHASSPSMLLLDVRNHYESRIGYFVDPRTGKAALRPPIRRFSQFPQYVKSHASELPGSKEEGREIMSYCTGGIRCEKGARFLYDQLSLSQSPDAASGSAPLKVYTLDGGIAAYLTWMEAEIAAGRKMASESLFKGRNYVFDARGSMGLGLEGQEIEKVATCHGCAKVEDRLGKCKRPGCHLVLVLCEECEQSGVSCCSSCEEVDENPPGDGGEKRKMCECERAREEALWGGKKEKVVKSQGWRMERRNRPKMDIRIKVIE